MKSEGPLPDVGERDREMHPNLDASRRGLARGRRPGTNVYIVNVRFRLCRVSVAGLGVYIINTLAWIWPEPTSNVRAYRTVGADVSYC